MDFTIELNSLLSLNIPLRTKNGRDSSVVPCARRRLYLPITIALAKQFHPLTVHNIQPLVTRTLVPLIVPAIGKLNQPPRASNLQPPSTPTPLHRSPWIHSLKQNENFLGSTRVVSVVVGHLLDIGRRNVPESVLAPES